MGNNPGKEEIMTRVKYRFEGSDELHDLIIPVEVSGFFITFM